MSDGNTVTVTTGTTPTNTVYTFNAATGNFTFTNKSTAIANGAAGLTFAKDQGLIPANGLRKVRTRTRAVPPFLFDVDSAGKLTIGGKATYLQGSGADQVLTTNNTSSATQATAGDLFAAAGAAAAGDASITLGGKTYTSAGTTTVSFTDTVTKDVLLTKMATAVSGTATDKVQIQLGSGITKANVNIDNTGKITGGTAAIPDELYLDSKGTLTDVKSYNTRHQVDQLTGKVTTIAGGKITGGAQNGQESLAADQVGKQAYLDAKGNLTLEKQSTGDKTTDPLKTLDAAFKVLNKLTGELCCAEPSGIDDRQPEQRRQQPGGRPLADPGRGLRHGSVEHVQEPDPATGWYLGSGASQPRRKPFCRCCVNHASAGTAGQVRTARSGLPDLARGPSVHAQSRRKPALCFQAREPLRRQPRICRNRRIAFRAAPGVRNSPELAWPHAPPVSRPLSGHMFTPASKCPPQPAFCPLIRFLTAACALIIAVA